MNTLCSLINAQQAAERQAEIDALNENEFDPEAQARIAERIQQANIQANMEAAMEHSPETFGQVNMLYVRLEVQHIHHSCRALLLNLFFSIVSLECLCLSG